MDISQRFCVRWNSYKSNLQTAFPKLLTSEHFVDVTLACEKQYIKCHKIVLSACSAYFETLLVNNPCQHPIIFMKDIQFWEIKALVEFMYKGEVNISQNQLDSLLKSAESLQIRGLSGTKQFINCDQSDVHDDCAEVRDESKTKRNKCDNEEIEECLKRKKKRSDEVEKCVQITSLKNTEESSQDKKQENENTPMSPLIQKPIKEETSEQDELDFESGYPATGEEEGETFSQDIFFPEHNNDPGPSGISDLCSLALNNVECVMDQERTKSASSPSSPTQGSCRISSKSQRKHQEHNYTNPALEDTTITITKISPTQEGCAPPPERENAKVRGSNKATASQSKNDAGDGNQRLSGNKVEPDSSAPSSSAQTERPPEVKNKTMKKDVFNRIRRSEEELQKAAEMVRGGMTFQTASDTFNIPISTIRFYMARRGILPQRRRGRGSSGVRDDDLIHPPFEIIHYRLPDIDKPI